MVAFLLNCFCFGNSCIYNQQSFSKFFYDVFVDIFQDIF